MGDLSLGTSVVLILLRSTVLTVLDLAFMVYLYSLSVLRCTEKGNLVIYF